MKRFVASSGFGGVLLVLAFIVGAYVGYEHGPVVEKVTQLSGKDDIGTVPTADFSPFWKAWLILNDKFVGSAATTTPPVSDQERVWGAIQGMVASLGDPYSVFMPPAEASIFEENIQGNFGGVGMEIGVRDGLPTVIAPLKGTPAERAGILAGDKIISVGGTTTIEMPIDKVINLIRGEVNTAVVLTLLRKEKEDPFDLTVVRDVITIPTISSELRDDGTFSIALYSFTASSPELFRAALRDFVVSGSNKLILDLRNNPGGFLDAAVDMASWFLPGGAVVVSEDFGDKRESVVYRSKGYDIFDDRFGLKMAILINQGSASASEILAGALAEHGKATLIGVQSFGKGSVQELVPVTADTSLKVTVAHWKTPEGKSISAGGLKPTIEVRADPDDLKGNDTQLKRAVQFLITGN